MPEASAPYSHLKVWLTIAGLVLGPILAIFLGYVSAKSTSAAGAAQLEQRMLQVEMKANENARMVEYFRDNYVLQREFQRQLDDQARTLQRIEDNLNMLRRGR